MSDSAAGDDNGFTVKYEGVNNMLELRRTAEELEAIRSIANEKLMALAKAQGAPLNSVSPLPLDVISLIVWAADEHDHAAEKTLYGDGNR
jgi:hypothetical protein